MKYIFNTEFMEVDFSRDEIKEFENKIAMNTKPEERTPGTLFKFKGITFSVHYILFDFDEDTKYIQLKQLTTKRKIATFN
jgi:hypothetical protein